MRSNVLARGVCDRTPDGERIDDAGARQRGAAAMIAQLWITALRLARAGLSAKDSLTRRFSIELVPPAGPDRAAGVFVARAPGGAGRAWLCDSGAGACFVFLGIQ